MQKIAIFLRKSAAENNFRKVLLAAFKEQSFIHTTICSGFFQERGKYFSSNCFINNMPMYPCNRVVDVVGVYNGIWKNDFNQFVQNLKTINCGCGTPIKINKRRISGYHWHAKIFIAADSEGPQLGIIGSSNITSRAFGLMPQWNFEADVILWNNANPAAKAIMDFIFQENNSISQNSVIVSEYLQEDPANRNLSLQQRLLSLRSEIEETSKVVE